MNRDPLARAIAAICITIALLGSGLLLAHRTLGAVPQQALHPDEFLPLIVKPRASATATATMATATTTATTSPTTTATATATTTATATATTPPTPVPTHDPLATAQLEIGNQTGFTLSYTLNLTPEGTLISSGDIAPNSPDNVLLLTIRPGTYIIAATTQCAYSKQEFSIASNQNKRISFICPPH